MNIPGSKAVKGILVEVLGWALILVGIAALVLPGPGLLALFAGMALLATRYSWAERRVQPLKVAALKAAHESVASPFRLLLSAGLVLVLIGFGILWGVHPVVPDWWPLSDKLWLPGGWGTGGSLIGSGLIAAGMIIYSFINFRKVTQD